MRITAIAAALRPSAVHPSGVRPSGVLPSGGRCSTLLAVCIAAAGCGGTTPDAPRVAPAAADGGSAAPAPTSRRPPVPAMATAAWGQDVVEAHAAGLARAPHTQAEVIAALQEMTPGSEQHAAELALQVYLQATTPQARGTALALMGAALLLDPLPQGYAERVTDARGLAMLAGSLDATDSLGQAARAFVMVQSGSPEQGERLVQVLAEAPKVAPEARLFIALARRALGDQGDAFIADAELALTQAPQSVRARALRAELALELGFPADVARAAGTDATAQHPWLLALSGRAKVIDGDVDGGVVQLRAALKGLDEGRRGDALYWLARSLTQQKGGAAEASTIADNLALRAGYAKEAQAVRAIVALVNGNPDKAHTAVEPLVAGGAQLPVDTDLAWLLIDSCAGSGDVSCVDKVSPRALALDGDVARFHKARATAILNAPPSAAAAAGSSVAPGAAAATDLREAHFLAPFDQALAENLGEPLCPGGPHAAQLARAVRKALLRGAPALAEAALKGQRTTCRVYATLAARTASDAAESVTRAVAAEKWGRGPDVGETDLVDLIGVLGGLKTDASSAALARLQSDKRPAVQRALALAAADHKDPEARRMRLASASHDAPEHPPHGPQHAAPGAAPSSPTR